MPKTPQIHVTRRLANGWEIEVNAEWHVGEGWAVRSRQGAADTWSAPSILPAPSAEPSLALWAKMIEQMECRLAWAVENKRGEG